MSITDEDMRDLIVQTFHDDNKERKSMRNSRKQDLFCKYWVNDPNFKPKALVFICHGYAEHCLRYTQLAHALIQHELYPFAHDHVGHGQSEGSEALIDDFDIYVRDAIQHIKMVKDKFPGLPVYAIGHSMGGCITLRMCVKEPNLITKLILIGPAVIPFKQFNNICVRFLVRVLAFLFPDLKLLAKIDESGLTLNEQQVALIKNDPLIYHGAMKAGFMQAFGKALDDLQMNLHKIKCPLFILHGQDDMLVPCEHSTALNENASSQNKTLKIYPGLRHQLHAEKEPDSDAIRQEMCQWLLSDIK